MRYKLKKFDVDAEQFYPEEGKPLPSKVTHLGDDCWHLRAQASWEEWMSNFTSQNLNPGDWIVRTNRGAVYRMSDYDFKRTYTDHDFPRLGG